MSRHYSEPFNSRGMVRIYIKRCISFRFLTAKKSPAYHTTQNRTKLCWIPRHSVPPLFSLVGVLWRTKHNTIDAILIQWHANKWQGILQLSPKLATKCNKRVQCSLAIERNRTQNVFVSLVLERNRIRTNTNRADKVSVSPLWQLKNKISG